MPEHCSFSSKGANATVAQIVMGEIFRSVCHLFTVGLELLNQFSTSENVT